MSLNSTITRVGTALALCATLGCAKQGRTTQASGGSVATSTESPPVALTIATTPEGVILTDANGRAVYVLEGPDGTPLVHCTGECATAFDPVTGKAIVATGDTTVQAALITTMPGPGGTQQAAYNGMPLYYSRADRAKGDMNGQGRKSYGTASLVSPKGTKVSR